jgi:hypothetical protein
MTAAALAEGLGGGAAREAEAAGDRGSIAGAGVAEAGVAGAADAVPGAAIRKRA